MKRTLRFAILMLILFGCKEKSTEPVPITPFEQWRSFNIHNYTIEQTRSCFCFYGGERMRITVQSDTVSSVMKLSDSTIILYPASKNFLSIDSLFGIIQNSRTDSLVVIYNLKYDYPEKLDINPQLHPVDGGELYESFNLEITK
ncbi:MAG: DUF6174 domain-containing protein [Ignavibacteriales bacterium]|nr:DUF6174 domain-containing protein [Ignavibacteriales bacterium]